MQEKRTNEDAHVSLLILAAVSHEAPLALQESPTEDDGNAKLMSARVAQ